MTSLQDQHAVAVNENANPLTDDELRSYLEQVPEWNIDVTVDRELFFLTRTYSFDSYEKVLHFHNLVGGLAEAEQHHPEMTSQYGGLTVKWWTHTVGGLHQNDFILAAKCDAAYQDLTESN